MADIWKRTFESPPWARSGWPLIVPSASSWVNNIVLTITSCWCLCSAYAKECVDATLHPGVLAAGAQKHSRRSAATRVTYRNRLRQAEVGRAILEDRAMRSAAPLPPALVESQASMLRNIHEAQVLI